MNGSNTGNVWVVYKKIRDTWSAVMSQPRLTTISYLISELEIFEKARFPLSSTPFIYRAVAGAFACSETQRTHWSMGT